MDTLIDPDKLYTEAETRQLLGGVGKTMLWLYCKNNYIAPFRRRPTMYLGKEIQMALVKISEANHVRESASVDSNEYGL